ncbi:MAG: UbiX family flavin prenyltransferase [Sulfolobales archaeon]|nr:UbiX family flavin prenyltransferase [Sulfolobales archaeon]MCX8199642.1 UbiX family flavin prenyltransferase [Sulfolobales archaeon]MDW8170596.1 UbiX family flavin prenyltransferase [Desulfurococcaceae archaeon]
MIKGVVVGLSGASGLIYGLKFIEVLCSLKEEGVVEEAYVVYTSGALNVAKYEVKGSLIEVLNGYKCLNGVYSDGDWSSPLASSSNTVGFIGVVIPCSMDVVANLANGLQYRLLERTMYNIIRTGRKLVLVIRETPLTTIDLENMLKLSRMGVVIAPASPGFYLNPKNIDDLANFMTWKVLDIIGATSKHPKWSP